MPSSIKELEQNSGMFPVEGADPKKLFIARIWNFAEPIGLYGILLVSIWTTLSWPVPLITVLLLWLLIFSPIAHYHYEKDLFLKPEQRNLGFYCAECRGFGSPRKYFRGDPAKNEPPLFKKHYRAIILMLALFGVMFTLALVYFWNYSQFDSIMKSLHLPATDGAKLGLVVVLIPVALVGLFFAFSFLVRFDTLVKGARQTLVAIVIGIPVILLFTLIFTLVPALAFFPDSTQPYQARFGIGIPLIAIFVALFVGYAYVTWRDSPVMKKRLHFILIMLAIGVPLAIIFAWIFLVTPALPTSPGGLPSNYQTQIGDKLGNFTFLGFIGQWTGYVWWGYFQELLALSLFNTMLSRAFNIKKRSSQMLAGLWTGFLFGLMHLPTFWLSFVVWIMGFAWTLFFMRSKSTFVMGVGHGALGSLMSELTPIKFSVGPSSL